MDIIDKGATIGQVPDMQVGCGLIVIPVLDADECW